MIADHFYAVESDGTIASDADISPRARAILERITRCAYMIDQHRRGISINSQRISQLQNELEQIETQQ